jgi:hypothetical protein
MAAHTSHLAGGAGGRWLIRAAEMAGLAAGLVPRSPDPVAAGWAGLPRIATCTPGGGAASVRTGRDFAVATAQRWGVIERRGDLAVVVSELLTNALRHTRPGPSRTWPRQPIRLGLLQLAPGLLCAVADPSTAVPVPRAPAELGETGRGLHIVGVLSDQWGYTAWGGGKVVWAMFAAPRHQPLSHSMAQPGADEH